MRINRGIEKGLEAETEILRIEDLSLIFHSDIFRPWTWRDVFTRLLRSPKSLLGTQRNRLVLFDHFFLTVKRGDRVGLLGVNGTGKTSLCRCIAGMYSPNQGVIRIRGKMRAIFDTSIAIQPELTGRENARLLVQLIYPELASEHEEMLEDALEFSELGTFLDAPYRLYSNGMQVRLCLSLISCRPSDLLILDEVFDGADMFFRKKISLRITQMIENSGAVLFVSHNFHELQQVCNRLIVLNQGKIAHDGDLDEGFRVYQRLSGEAQRAEASTP